MACYQPNWEGGVVNGDAIIGSIFYVGGHYGK